MGFLYGFVGAVLGSLLGLASLTFAVTVSQQGHLPDAALITLAYAPISLIVGSILGIIAGLLARRFVRVSPNSKQVKHRIGGAALAVCVLVPALLGSAYRETLAPSDRQLIGNFRRHRAVFDAIAQMSQEDKGYISISCRKDGSDEVQKEGISPSRAEQYRLLLNKTAARHLIAGTGKTAAYSAKLSCWFQGSSQTKDDDKGYAYLAVPPKPLADTLDNYQPKASDEDTMYRHIEGHWYLYYEHLP